MPDNEVLNGGEPNTGNTEPTAEEEEEAPEATVEGTFSKKGYCQGCFSIVTWDDPAVEETVMGNRVVYCPECGAPVKVATAEIVEG